MAKKEKKWTDEEIQANKLKMALETNRFISKDPAKIFSIGEEVIIGNLINPIIVEDLNNEHLVYKVKYGYKDKNKLLTDQTFDILRQNKAFGQIVNSIKN